MLGTRDVMNVGFRIVPARNADHPHQGEQHQEQRKGRP
jgi:hypothetical protein